MLIVDLLLLLASCTLLVASGSWLVKLILRIASYLRLSEFVVAFIIMAFSTSLPELFVGIDSAIVGNPSLSLGNVIGANIANVTLVIGIVALLGKGLKIKNPKIGDDSFFMLLIATVPITLMMFDKTLSREDGGVLVFIFMIYIWHLIKERRMMRGVFDRGERKNLAINCILFLLSLGLLFLSAHLVVGYATKLAIELSLPSILIGLFLIAIATTLPELIFGIRAILAKKADLAVGDAIGSVVCNSTLVLGVTALISPITNSFTLFLTSAISMVMILFLFMTFIRKRSLSIVEAIGLIIVYILFIFLEFYFK